MIWHKRDKRNDIFSLTLWVYVMARVFGFWPFTIRFDENRNKPIVCVTKFDYAWFCMSIVFYIMFIHFAVMDHSGHIDQKFTFIEVSLNKMTTLNHILVALLCIILDMVNREVLWKIILKFKAFDDEMNALGRGLNFKLAKRFLLLAIISVTGLTYFLVFYSVTIYDQFTDLRNFDLLMLCIIISILIGAHLIISVTYSFFLLNTKARFHQLNHLISQGLPLEPVYQFFKFHKALLDANVAETNLINRLRRLHDSLNDIVEMINRCYSVQIMMNVATCFGYTIICFFILYRQVVARSEFSRQISTVHVIWCVYYLVFITSTICIASGTTREGERTARLVHKIIQRSKNPETISRLMQFSQQLQHRSPVVSCGLFNFDWTLCYSMVGATTTYLTILIQFDSSTRWTQRYSSPMLNNTAV